MDPWADLKRENSDDSVGNEQQGELVDVWEGKVENINDIREYELSDEWGLSSRIFMKALMMKTVFSEVTGSIPTLEDVYMERIYPFDVALTLNKMMSRGAEMAVNFTYELADWI